MVDRRLPPGQEYVWVDRHGDLHGRGIAGETLRQKQYRVVKLALEQQLIEPPDTPEQLLEDYPPDPWEPRPGGRRVIIEEPSHRSVN